jgi:hypothetical protein
MHLYLDPCGSTVFRDVAQRFLHDTKQAEGDLSGQVIEGAGALAVGLYTILFRKLSAKGLDCDGKAKQLQLR